MKWMLFFIPAISALTGWFTSFIAIKYFFSSHRLRTTRLQLAIRSGRMISKEFLSTSEIEQIFLRPANIEKIIPFLESHIDIFLREKLSVEIPMIGMLIGEKTILQVKGVFMKELKEIFPDLIKQYILTICESIDVERIITGKIEHIFLNPTESRFKKIISDELKYVEVFGAILGFIVGLIQVVITIVIK